MGKGKSLSTRLIVAIVTSLLEEAALVAIVLWGLPQVGIEIPLAGLIIMMLILAAYDVGIYRMGSRALRKKPVNGLPDMVGTKGKVMNALVPNGQVRIKDELWDARSSGETIEAGAEVIVVEQDGLKLTVCRSGDKDKKRQIS